MVYGCADADADVEVGNAVCVVHCIDSVAAVCRHHRLRVSAFAGLPSRRGSAGTVDFRMMMHIPIYIMHMGSSLHI